MFEKIKRALLTRYFIVKVLRLEARIINLSNEEKSINAEIARLINKINEMIENDIHGT